MRSIEPTRRAFLNTMGAAGMGGLLSGTVESARGFAANDTLNVACIGTGGRCQHLMRSLVKVPGVRIVGVCDVWDVALDAGKKLADPLAAPAKDHRTLLDRKDIDAILIGAPDHQHVPLTIDACGAGKDVYVEKPLTHDLAEGAKVIAAQNESKRIVQVGMQQRSMPHIAKARELIKAGRLGKVFKVALSWNRNAGERLRRGPQGVNPSQVDWKRFLGTAPDQPFDEYRFRNWRWFWDFGGGLLTDLMVHWIDVAHWVLDLPEPVRAVAIGEHFAAADAWQTPDTIQCLLAYPGDVQAHFEGTFSNAHNRARIEFMGTEGTLWVDRGGYVLTPDRGGETESLILGTDQRRGLDFYDKPDGELLHLTEWVEAVRARRKPNTPAEAGVLAAAAAHMGNLAYRGDKVVVRKESTAG